MNKTLTHSGILGRLSVTFLTWRRFLARQILPFDMTLKQHYVLRQLEKKEFLYPSDIAEMLFADRPTATVIIDNLARRGLVRRDREDGNRKFVRVSITPAGRARMAELDTARWDAFDPLDSFTPEEAAEFDRLLRKLKTRIDEFEKGSSPGQTV
jgi:DNA-binding MarR family transcriptional regulator